MSEKVNLKVMKCPTCGANLKAENGTEAITCVYCGNTIVPVMEATPTTKNDNSGFNGILKVEGIKTSSSALAYIEQFFEEYDWDSFSYAQTLSISEIDKLAHSLKVSSADDKNTWFVCFKAIFVPYIHKITGCKEILNSVIEEYKKDNLDAYSKFDAYKRIATMLLVYKNEIVANLEKITAYATKYGATAEETAKLHSDVNTVKSIDYIKVYTDIEDIPEIQKFIFENNERIKSKLAKSGIDAESEYAKAKALIDEKSYVQALDILISLNGYSDSKKLINKINKYFLISDVLEIEGKLYFFKKEDSADDTLALYPTKDGIICNKPLVNNIKQMATNYADIIYYINGDHRLIKYNLSTNTEEKLFDKRVNEKFRYLHKRQMFFMSKANDEYGELKYNLIKLDVKTGAVDTVLENIKEVTSTVDNKIIYTVSEKTTDKDGYETDSKTITNIINIDTMDIVELGTKNVKVEGYIDNYVVYTQNSPTKFNKNLYIKALNSNEPEKLIEQNIYAFCNIISNRLFYYVGNSRNKTLINVNCDGSGRKEWPLYISEVLFEQGGWLYFIRKSGYNSVLCKSRLDGSKFSIIAADIEKFIDIKNGYLYYINDEASLVKIRMDGSNLQELCEDVENVLAIKEDKIIFVSIDDRIKSGEFQTTTKIVKSIYAVDFTGSGIKKLAYNIKDAKEYDDNTVYYVAAKEIKSSYDTLEDNIDVLYKLDVDTNNTEILLDFKIEKEESNPISPAVIALIVFSISLLLALIGFAAGSAAFGIFCLIIAITALLIAIVLYFNRSQTED